MRIAIIIPSHNEAAMLPETLQAVERCRVALTGAGVITALIVCANKCTDETGAIALQAGAIVNHYSYRQTAAAARNSGAGCVANNPPPDWLLFVDADTTPTPPLVMAMLSAIRTDRYDAGSCLVNGAGTFGTALWNSLAKRLKRLTGAFLFVRRSTFVQIGGFDPDTATGEELGLGNKIPAARRVILSQAIVLRPRNGSLTGH